nr:reverse transcriptase domain-containing protein [Tanacetum cinerariifolium]
MLEEHNITYRPRTSVKGSVLTDFLAEMPDKSLPDASVVETQQQPWTLFMDGSSCVDGSGARLILTSPEGTEFTYALIFQFAASNNEVEYEALIAGLRIAAQMGVQNVYRLHQLFYKPSTTKQKQESRCPEQDCVNQLCALIQTVLVYILKEKSIKEKEVKTVVKEDGPTWMTPIIEYLREGTLPSDRKEGIDIAGPFSKGLGKVKSLIVAIDYFTKCIEAEAVATITGNQVKKFMWDNIVCRFSLPGEIVSDNEKQFSDNLFKDWCDKLSITQRFASVKHPQSNGLVERANRSLGEGIKARLGEGNNNWVEELPHVLWAHRTMIKPSHGDTPFSLTYGTEAVILAEIGMPTYSTAAVDVVHNDEELQLNLDLLEERRERAAICEAKAKLKVTKYYNARVRGFTFRPDDFVYRSNDASHDIDGGKLGPKWEGPYEVTKALGDGAYKLRSVDRTVLPGHGTSPI